MVLERRVIFGNNKDPMMVLEKYSCTLSPMKLDKTKVELLKYIEQEAGSSSTWGYFPAFNPERHFPACKDLEFELKKRLLSQIKGEFSLAFIRLAIKKPISHYGGLHIDVDIAAGHTRTNPNEIVRLLVNTGDSPRILEYVNDSLTSLLNKGIKIQRDKYQILKLPKSVEINKIEIPPKEKHAIWVLKFWSSIIPHAGITSESGHFLVAYGKYSKRKEYLI